VATVRELVEQGKIDKNHWLTKAKVRDENVRIILGSVMWIYGTWLDGIWKGGTWEFGNWRHGTWEGGTWKHGEWYDGVWWTGDWYHGIWKGGTWQGGMWGNGTWENGNWEDGNWKGGVWKGGTWEGGIWKGGAWKGGIWEDGTWKGGFWYDGIWEDGTWKGGLWYDGKWQGGKWGGGRWLDKKNPIPTNEIKITTSGNSMKITKSELREIIREEIQKVKSHKALNEGLLIEATNSYVGIVDKNGKITSTYVHYDGYPAGVGMVLKNHFKNPAKIKKLLKTDGGTGISVLDKGIDGGEGHSFEKPVDGQTVFYGRDRGEKGGRFLKGYENQVWHLVSSARKGSGAEYVYLYDMKDGKWYYTRTSVKLGTDVDAVNKLVEL
jgi:hypothetical protein